MKKLKTTRINQTVAFLTILIFGVITTLPIFFNDETFFDNKIIEERLNLRVSAPISPIFIDNNWTAYITAGVSWLSGNGTSDDPYVIEDIEIDGQYNYHCIRIENSIAHFVVRNCTFVNGPLWDSRDFEYGGGIRLFNVSNGQLIENNCSYNDYGIFMEDCAENTLFGNDLYYNFDDAIVIWDCNNIDVLENNVIFNEGRGIYFEFSDNCNILENEVHSNLVYGLDLYELDNSVVTNNNISNNGFFIPDGGVSSVGINIDCCHFNDFVRNTVSDQLIGGIGEGIKILGSNDNYFFMNDINHNGDGILITYGFDDSKNNIFFGNNVTNNMNYGAMIEYSSSNNTFYCNNFVNNTIHARDSTSIDDNFWFFSVVGNYWDNYTGVDTDGNGIGDSPYEDIEGSVAIDLYPLMEPVLDPEEVYANHTDGGPEWSGEPIYIDDSSPTNSWAHYKSSGASWLSGNGTSDDPYVIENVKINGQVFYYCIHIENSIAHFIVRNCTLLNASFSTRAGIRLYNVANGQVIDNNCTYNYNGVYIQDCVENITLFGNEIKSNSESGIVVDDCDFVDILENNITNNGGNGIFTYNSDDCNISLNEIHSNEGTGLYLDNSEYNTAEENKISNNGFSDEWVGIELIYSHDNDFLRNTISDELKFVGGSWVGQGIRVCDSYRNYFFMNNIIHNGQGVVLTDTGMQNRFNWLFGNNITDNVNYGVFIADGQMLENSIYCNNFINNSVHARNNDDRYNFWNASTVGNYWDDYTGVDADGNGLGDTPYNLFRGCDYLPLMEIVLDPEWVFANLTRDSEEPDESMGISPIYIFGLSPTDDWVYYKSLGVSWLSGEGTFDNPYVIENQFINASSASENRSCIYIEESRAHFIIRNCTLVSASEGLYRYKEGAGITLNRVTNGQLIGNNCSFNDIGIKSADNYDSSILVTGNDLILNKKYGLYLETIGNCEVTENNMLYNGIGMSIFSCRYSNFSKNEIHFNDGYGMQTRNIRSCSFEENNISNNGGTDEIVVSSLLFLKGSATDNTNGIFINNSYDNEFLKNIISNEITGIQMQNSSENYFFLNIIHHNKNGINLDLQSNKNTFFGNNFTDNTDKGVSVAEGCSDNLLYCNNFINNTIHASDLNPPLVNHWNTSTIGNYWDDYGGVDTDGDGIGDSSNGLDYLPIIVPVEDPEEVIEDHQSDMDDGNTEDQGEGGGNISFGGSFLLFSLLAIASLILIFRKRHFK
ncbi:MAG: right-handed parallel beta-helix repeat-containing protein [Candidatus Lokiarchaeota archaeon]|nr:right-handed parallel beta-helix repeat-containing protein [Candidatus Lokiarchaeota archaeon]